MQAIAAQSAEHVTVVVGRSVTRGVGRGVGRDCGPRPNAHVTDGPTIKQPGPVTAFPCLLCPCLAGRHIAI